MVFAIVNIGNILIAVEVDVGRHGSTARGNIRGGSSSVVVVVG